MLNSSTAAAACATGILTLICHDLEAHADAQTKEEQHLFKTLSSWVELKTNSTRSLVQKIGDRLEKMYQHKKATCAMINNIESARDSLTTQLRQSSSEQV